MFGNCSLTILFFLSAMLDRQGLSVAVQVDRKNQNSESFSPQLCQGFWSKLKDEIPKIVVVSPTVTAKNSKQKEAMWQQCRLCLALAEYQICGVGLSCVEGHPSGSFHNLGSLLHSLGFAQESRKHVVPTEWQIRAVLGANPGQGFFQSKRHSIANMR